MTEFTRDLVNETRRKRFIRHGNFTQIPTISGCALPRDGVIVIQRERTDRADGYIIELSGPLFGVRAESPMIAAIGVSPQKLLAHVELCRRAWNDVVALSIKGKGLFSKQRRPFLEKVAQSPDLLQEVGKQLAIAGEQLFSLLFLNQTPRLDKLVARLVEGLFSREAVITVYADDFFIPWNMLYFHPPANGGFSASGDNFVKEGFFGYRHVIEHATDNFVPSPTLKAATGTVKMGFTFDPSVDASQGLQTVQKTRDYLQGHRALSFEERLSKDEIALAFRTNPFPDQISYYFLHARTSQRGQNVQPARFFIGEDSIEASEIEAWCRTGCLTSQPFFFFNACEAGQMKTRFYESFALQLLQLEARGLMGPQIDIPTVFAGEYAKRFFERLLSREYMERIGQVAHALTRQFWDEDHNPLGLAYSLYKGLDCYVEWPSDASGAQPSGTPVQGGPHH